MNKKGMMFTLEVLISIIILAIAISVVLGANASQKTETTFINFTNQSSRITSVYFDLTLSSDTGNTTICGDYFKYSTGTITKSAICEGYE